MAQKNPLVAYFCMEYGLRSDFKIYSGGLGILAGDVLKGAKDTASPLIGIGILWKQGYTEQRIGPDGKPYDCFPNFSYDFLEDTGVIVPVRVRGSEIQCKVWKVTCCNNADLYLLDTDLPQNGDRFISGNLYNGFSDVRVAQEIVLGVGGVRALRALKLPVEVFHFNEGHAVFAGLELIREKTAQGVPLWKAKEETRRQVVFTTHTPVKAGNEHHNHETLQYLGANMGLNIQEMHEIGGTPFNMTVAALRLSRKSNAVAELHTETANDMWKEVEGRSEIISITNGIHHGTWVDPEIQKVVSNGEQLWKRHQELKGSLVKFVEQRTGQKLNSEKLIIGFSRRAAGYKRSNLLFSDLDRARQLLKDQQLQIVFSGKAHPHDDGGKAIVANLVQAAKEYPESVVFLENYDMVIGAALTRGSDVWLNNPRRPLEACGTSGMKAAMNGVLNLSTLDGWWPEACKHGVNGWAIGDEVVHKSSEEHDKIDALSLYEVLEKEVLPTFYGDKKKWISMMQESIHSTYEKFSASTMVNNYFSKLYVD